MTESTVSNRHAPRHAGGKARASRAAALLLAMLLALLAAPNSQAQREDPLAELNRGQRDLFRTYTRLFCRQFYRYGDDRFVVLPNYARDRENSTGRSIDQATEEMTVTRNVRRNGADVVLHFPPPRGEVVATAMVIPAIDVGHYGYVNSFRVRQVLGPDEMIVSQMVLIPGDQVPNGRNEAADLRRALVQRQRQNTDMTFRLLGFSTEGLAPGDLFTGTNDRGIHIAVMSTDPQHDFVLVNYRRLRPVRTSEFADALNYVQISPVVFIDMVRDNRERLETDGDKASLLSIYSRFYDRYRPARLSRIAAVRPEPEPQRPTPQPQTPPDRPRENTGDQNNNADNGNNDSNTNDNGPENNDGSENEYNPDPPSEPRPPREAEPRPRPQPVEEDEEDDDWEYRERNNGDAPQAPSFFGIPL